MAIARHPWETRLRLALAELGPTFIKLGQLLSTRPDLVASALADEFQQLRKTSTQIPRTSAETDRKRTRPQHRRTLRRVRSRSDGLGFDRLEVGEDPNAQVVHDPRGKFAGDVDLNALEQRVDNGEYQVEGTAYVDDGEGPSTEGQAPVDRELGEQRTRL